MSASKRRTTRFGMLGGIGLLTALAVGPALAEGPASEAPCGGRRDTPCRTEALPAHHGVATIPGVMPVQPIAPLATAVPARPWLKSGS